MSCRQGSLCLVQETPCWSVITVGPMKRQSESVHNQSPAMLWHHAEGYVKGDA